MLATTLLGRKVLLHDSTTTDGTRTGTIVLVYIEHDKRPAYIVETDEGNLEYRLSGGLRLVPETP